LWRAWYLVLMEVEIMITVITQGSRMSFNAFMRKTAGKGLSVKDRKAKKTYHNHCRPWTPKQVDRLIKFRKRGYQTKRLSEKFKRTRGAIGQKVRKLEKTGELT